MSTTTIELSNTPAVRADAIDAVRDALNLLPGSGAKKLVIPKDRYHFYPDTASEEYLFVSNNDASLKAIAFPLFDIDDLEIDGQGSEFIFHGFITPFALVRCQNVRLNNFKMDWERPLHSEALILDMSTDNTTVDLRFTDEFPYAVAHGELRFTGFGTHEPVVPGPMLEFDPIRREPAYKVHDNYAFRSWHSAQELEPGVVRLSTQFAQPPTPGNFAAFGASRHCPGIVVASSRQIDLEDIVIYHSGGMGVIGQSSRDVRLTRVSVTPSVEHNRVVSASADATHFANCAGHIEFTDCVFENQLDDPGNFHGIYGRIAHIVSPTCIRFELVHPQQRGIDITYAGDEIELVSQTTLMTYFRSRVASFTRLNQQFFNVELCDSIPDGASVGDCAGSLTMIPDVTIRGCRVGSNRARGFLVSTAGHVLLEKNLFHNPGSAILIAGDANYWFESGCVRDVKIVNNIFDNCLFGVWGRAVIDICPEIKPEHRSGSYYHKNIRIENNEFRLCDARILNAHCVDGLVFKDNKIERSAEYPWSSGDAEAFHVEACANVLVDGCVSEVGN